MNAYVLFPSGAQFHGRNCSLEWSRVSIYDWKLLTIEKNIVVAVRDSSFRDCFREKLPFIKQYINRRVEIPLNSQFTLINTEFRKERHLVENYLETYKCAKISEEKEFFCGERFWWNTREPAMAKEKLKQKFKELTI